MKQLVPKLRSWLDAHPAPRRAAFWSMVLVRDVRGLMAPRLTAPTPRHVNIEPSNLCNANCVFCGYQNQTRRHQAIALPLAFEIIDQARRAGVNGLGLTPIVGEPLVNRELEEMIKYARQPPNPLEVGLTTNGLLLTRKRYESLVEAGVNHISISMSYPDADDYARVYRSSSFKTLMRNLQEVLDVYRPEQCGIDLGIRSARPDPTEHPLLERARRAGWDVQRNVHFDDWSGSVGALIEKNGLSVRPLRPKRLPCSMLFSGPHFLSDGRATACGCRDLDGASDLRLPADSLLRDMRATYEVGEVEALRRRFRRNDAPEICRSCRHYNPQFEGESMRLRVMQLCEDAKYGALQITTQKPGSRRLPLVVDGRAKAQSHAGATQPQPTSAAGRT